MLIAIALNPISEGIIPDNMVRYLDKHFWMIYKIFVLSLSIASPFPPPKTIRLFDLDWNEK